MAKNRDTFKEPSLIAVVFSVAVQHKDGGQCSEVRQLLYINTHMKCTEVTRHY